ncbi:LysE family translocator [Yoonia sp. SS1-5]|uniref:LysE family translocator n=1 Tax=Yoonia rhodophyticola TaxID=3137370 RepID=A0AAN0NM03_9RHOB
MAEFLPLLGFIFVGLFSPGPNVILLATSGARFGYRASLPHIFGVAIGVGVTAGLTGFGVGALLNAVPTLTFVLKCGAALWIGWMAYRLWTADPVAADAQGRPFTFLEAVLFQWINPKVWAVALSAMAYLPDMSLGSQAMTLAVAFSVINLGVCNFWTYAGALLSYLLGNAAAWRLFMRIMAIALAGFSVLVFL